MSSISLEISQSLLQLITTPLIHNYFFWLELFNDGQCSGAFTFRFLVGYEYVGIFLRAAPALLSTFHRRSPPPFVGALLVLFTSWLEPPPDSSPELSGCLCTLPFPFETTKQKSNTRHLNVNTVNSFPLAMYLLHV